MVAEQADSFSEVPVIESSKKISSTPIDRIPQYTRNLLPTNLILSAEDIGEFCELISDINGRSQKIEFNNLDLTAFKDSDVAWERVLKVMALEYNYRAAGGDSVQGLGVPNTADLMFPDDLISIFVSNVSFSERTVNIRPLNTVEVFLSFEKPSLKIDLQTIPSNPTGNLSVININGRDEDWVISASERIQGFLKKRSAPRPIIHGSGTYDYFVYLAFLPALILAFIGRGSPVARWLEQQSMFLNVVLALYALLLSLLTARFLFQYIRWLFPPMEYYRRSRVGAYMHRAIAGFIGSAIFLSATYDMLKTLVVWVY
jgi:hypothetical protein